MAIYWVQTNEDMNPVRVNLSSSEVKGVIKVLEALADQGELVELSDENSEILFDNSDDWYANRRIESYKRESYDDYDDDDDVLMYEVYFNGSHEGAFDNYKEAETELFDLLDDAVRGGYIADIDLEETYIEDSDGEVHYCADSDEDYKQYV